MSKEKGLPIFPSETEFCSVTYREWRKLMIVELQKPELSKIETEFKIEKLKVKNNTPTRLSENSEVTFKSGKFQRH